MAFPARLLGAAALLLAFPAAAQVRGVTQITSSAQSHQSPKLSPDGQFVAFRGGGMIGSVGFLGGTEVALVTAGNLGDFVWAPNSAGLYLIEGADLKFVSRGGGSAQRLAGLPGQGHRLWCVDSIDRKLWGTRFEPTTSTYHIFTVATSGSGMTDIVGSALVLDQVRIDPSNTKIVYRESLAIPFSPCELWLADAGGQNPVSLTGGLVDECPDLLDWADNGQSLAFTMQSPTTGLPQLARLTTASTQIRMLTEGQLQHRQSSVSLDRQWVVHQAQYPGGAGPAILPPQGGGLVPLASDNKTYLFHGPPSTDGTGTRVVFAATEIGGTLPQLYTARLDRELRIEPRAELNGAFTVLMPIASNEVGAIFISAGLAPPLGLPGFKGALFLNGVLTLVSGGSGNGLLGVPIFVPNVGSLLGQSVYFQGLRVVSLSQGDFTRHAEVRIF